MHIAHDVLTTTNTHGKQALPHTPLHDMTNIDPEQALADSVSFDSLWQSSVSLFAYTTLHYTTHTSRTLACVAFLLSSLMKFSLRIRARSEGTECLIHTCQSWNLVRAKQFCT